MEENIVLVVDLESSKRPLPIEDEIGPSIFPRELKELAGSWNGGGKDKKDGQMPTVPSISQIANSLKKADQSVGVICAS